MTEEKGNTRPPNLSPAVLTVASTRYTGTLGANHSLAAPLLLNRSTVLEQISSLVPPSVNPQPSSFIPAPRLSISHHFPLPDSLLLSLVPLHSSPEPLPCWCRLAFFVPFSSKVVSLPSHRSPHASYWMVVCNPGDTSSASRLLVEPSYFQIRPDFSRTPQLIPIPNTAHLLSFQYLAIRVPFCSPLTPATPHLPPGRFYVYESRLPPPLMAYFRDIDPIADLYDFILDGSPDVDLDENGLVSALAVFLALRKWERDREKEEKEWQCKCTFENLMSSTGSIHSHRWRIERLQRRCIIGLESPRASHRRTETFCSSSKSLQKA